MKTTKNNLVRDKTTKKRVSFEGRTEQYTWPASERKGVKNMKTSSWKWRHASRRDRCWDYHPQRHQMLCMKQSIGSSSKSKESGYDTTYNRRDENACSLLDAMFQYYYEIIFESFQLVLMFVKQAFLDRLNSRLRWTKVARGAHNSNKALNGSRKRY